MAYHNLFKTFAWLGGHADGEKDMLKVAIKEMQEESGIKNYKILSEDIFTLEMKIKAIKAIVHKYSAVIIKHARIEH